MSQVSELIESRNGIEYHKWIVNFDTPEDCWGEGYVIHLGSPMAIFKWGFTDSETNKVMGAGIRLDDGNYLSILTMNSEPNVNLESLRIQAISAVLEFLTKEIESDSE